MKASEGKLGRIFIVTLDRDDALPGALENFAHDRGINIAQVILAADSSVSGIIAPAEDGKPVLRLAGTLQSGNLEGEVIIQEILGINLKRIQDQASGLRKLAVVQGSVTRVMEKPAPAPEEPGPGTVPVYLFNAEFN